MVPFWSVFASLTDMIHGSGAELWEENFDSEELEVLDDERPKVEDVVPAEVVSLLDDDGASTQQLRLDRSPETARTTTDNANLNPKINGKMYMLRGEHFFLRTIRPNH
jgi:hypothetical protein